MRPGGGKRRTGQIDRRSVQDFYQHFCFEESTDGFWLARVERVLPIDLPIEQQIEHLCRHTYLVHCNRSFARFHNTEHREDLIGMKLPDFLLRSNPSILKTITSFLENGYRIINAESTEIDASGYSKYFLNTIVGVVSNHSLTYIWGKKCDVQGFGGKGYGGRFLEQLSETQRNIVRLTVQGLTLKEIGYILHVNPKTVATFRLRLLRRLGLRSLAQLIVSVADVTPMKSEDENS